jgi:3-deoxy-D-manno-octulosonate 8-phosphate phosphatase (KDO 8-P phosphatase)
VEPKECLFPDVNNPMIDPTVARRIKLVGFDVDGVLSNGGIYIGRVGDHAVEFKQFNSQDGPAAWFLRRAGLVTALVSGRRSDATSLRARELKIEEVIQDDTGGGRKLEAFEAMIARRGISWSECAFVGDDIADLPLLLRVAIPIAVANAVTEVKAIAHFVTDRAGGDGAMRSATEALLRARGNWQELVNRYLEERGHVVSRPG